MSTKKHYYAARAPRGFANELRVHSFTSLYARDAWLEQHGNLGIEADRRAYPVTARTAQATLRRKSDAATEQFNVLIEHNGGA